MGSPVFTPEEAQQHLLMRANDQALTLTERIEALRGFDRLTAATSPTSASDPRRMPVASWEALTPVDRAKFLADGGSLDATTKP